MQDNNNDNNLFTQMFGLETEESPLENSPKSSQQENNIQSITNVPGEEKLNNSQQVESSLQQPKQVIIPSTQENSNNLNQLNFSSQNDEVINLSSFSNVQTSSNNTQIELSSNDNSPAQTYTSTSNLDLEDFAPFEKSDIKNGANALAQVSIILIVILFLCGGWFFVYNTFVDIEEKELSKVNQESNDIVDGNQSSEQNNEYEEKTITFDETLSFYNGLTNNSNELNQKVAYTPAASTGVIKCSSTENVLIDSNTENFDLYFYYQNYQLKKFLLLNKAKYTNESDYQLLIEGCNILMENFETSEGVKYKCNLNKSAREVETTVLLNLAYGNYYQTSHKDYYLKFEYTYNENIKNSMSRILTNSYYLNKVTCSTVLT